jgi:hypothetical protein
VVKTHCNCAKVLKIQAFQDCFSRYDYGCLDKEWREGKHEFCHSFCYKVESCWFWKETKYYLYSLLHTLITALYFDHSQQWTNTLANLSEQSKMTHPQSRWCVPKMGLGFRMDTKGRDWSEVLGWEQPLCASGTPDSWDHSNKNTNQYVKRSNHIESCKHWFCFLQHHCLVLSNLYHHDIHLAQLRIAS